jgi:hypothetical protein
MKGFTLVVGAFHILCFVLGTFNVIDYHVCIKDNGPCAKTEHKEENT